MKNFIQKTLIIITLPLTLYILIFSFLKFNLEKKISEKDFIIIGDSHTQHLNIPNTYNYSVSGSPYIIHYNFLHSIKKSLNDKTVIIAFGYHNISSLYENRFNNNVNKPGWIPMVNSELNATNFINKSYNYSWRQNKLENIFSKNRLTKLYLNNYKNKSINSKVVKKDTAFFAKTIEKHFYLSGFLVDDKIQEKYLSLIIELLLDHNCKIILLNTPVTSYYQNHIPERIKIKFDKMISKYNKTLYLNLNKILIKEIDETIFKDADHVNLKGDKIIEDYITNNIFSVLR